MKASHPRGRTTRPLAALALTAIVGLGGVALPSAAVAKKPAKLKVETRNLYLGADLTPAITAPNPPAAYAAAGDIYRSVIDTNFKGRARLIANEVADNNPALIGLQEVALWRRGQRGAPDGDATPSQEVFVDFLDLLQGELRSQGLKYVVAVKQQEADIELPVDISQPSDGNPEFDGRLTMSDVILAKKGLKKGLKNGLTNPIADNYPHFLTVNTALGPVEVYRGYTSIDVKKNRRSKRFRFVNTHLEAFNAFIRNQQANDLVSTAGPTFTNKPVVLVGDLNSDPADPTVDPQGIPTRNAEAYDTVVGSGFIDRGVTVDTCCFSSNLLDPPPAAFTSRIDHVLGRGPISALSTTLIGDDASNRTDTSLWPSDHGGVVVKLKIG